MLLKKSFCTRDQNFFWLYTRLSCKDVGDLIDAVEKVLGMAALRNNRIIESDFLNRSCATHCSHKLDRNTAVQRAADLILANAILRRSKELHGKAARIPRESSTY
jgi:hypothetical protein